MICFGWSEVLRTSSVAAGRKTEALQPIIRHQICSSWAESTMWPCCVVITILINTWMFQQVYIPPHNFLFMVISFAVFQAVPAFLLDRCQLAPHLYPSTHWHSLFLSQPHSHKLVLFLHSVYQMADLCFIFSLVILLYSFCSNKRVLW